MTGPLTWNKRTRLHGELFTTKYTRYAYMYLLFIVVIHALLLTVVYTLLSDRVLSDRGESIECRHTVHQMYALYLSQPWNLHTDQSGDLSRK